MTCYNPLTGYMLINQKTENGKKKITFNDNEVKGRAYTKIDLPCSQCIGCRIERARGWAIRCVHEASTFNNNCFITLTFSEENLNKSGSLVKSDFQKFMKRLRKQQKGNETVKDDKGNKTNPIRYFHCGEYGDKLNRPHHHACLFNFDFHDKEYYKTKNGYRWYTSETLQNLWPYGYHSIGDVTFESAAYVASYITKKITGDKAEKHYTKTNAITGELHKIIPEYITMSRRPGIGKRWFDQYKKDVYPKDYITEQGRKIKTPKYYDKIFDETNPRDMETIKKQKEGAKQRKRERQNNKKINNET